MTIRRRLSRLEEQMPTDPEDLEIIVRHVIVDLGEDGPVETGEVYRTRVRIHEARSEVLERLVPEEESRGPSDASPTP